MHYMHRDAGIERDGRRHAAAIDGIGLGGNGGVEVESRRNRFDADTAILTMPWRAFDAAIRVPDLQRRQDGAIPFELYAHGFIEKDRAQGSGHATELDTEVFCRERQVREIHGTIRCGYAVEARKLLHLPIANLTRMKETERKIGLKLQAAGRFGEAQDRVKPN